MNNVFSLYSYWLLNGAILFAFIICRALLACPFFGNSLSQFQKLQFGRYSLLSSLMIFSLMPYFSDLLPFTDNNFQIQPLLKQASVQFLKDHATVQAQIHSLHTTSWLPSSQTLWILVMVAGGLFLSGKYIYNILALHSLSKSALSKRTINNVSILYIGSIQTPFCWSFFTKHYIAIPMSLLTNPTDFKLAIRHELQHIRQSDTYWLHFLSILKLVCFWNPAMKWWFTWFTNTQEFACDEAVILKQTAPTTYAQCLINAAKNHNALEILPQTALGIVGLTKHHQDFILKRRIVMLFHYKNIATKKILLFCAYLVCFFTAASVAYAFDKPRSHHKMLTQQQVITLFRTSDSTNDLGVAINPSVVRKLNQITHSRHARHYMRSSLTRMQKYKPSIEAQLKTRNMPTDLLAVPLVESGYKPLPEHKNPVLAAGIWQIIPNTGKNLGMTINKQQDDRMNTELSTKAALDLLNNMYTKYHDWKLAVIAYEYGDKTTDRLITTTGTRDAWKLAHSAAAPVGLKDFLAMFDASIIIMHNPSLVSKA